MNRACVDAVVDDRITRIRACEHTADPCVQPRGYFLIARIRRVYYTMYYMPHVRTYARGIQIDCVLRYGPTGIPDEIP